MKTPHNSISGHGFVILDKGYTVTYKRRNQRVKLALGETLKEIAPGIFEYLRFYYQCPLECSFNYVHFSINLSKYCPYWFLSMGWASSRILSSLIQPRL